MSLVEEKRILQNNILKLIKDFESKNKEHYINNIYLLDSGQIFADNGIQKVKLLEIEIVVKN